MAVVLEQLIEVLLPTPEISKSNQFNGNIIYNPLYQKLYRKDENEEKRGREWPDLRKTFHRFGNALFYVTVRLKYQHDVQQIMYFYKI